MIATSRSLYAKCVYTDTEGGGEEATLPRLLAQIEDMHSLLQTTKSFGHIVLLLVCLLTSDQVPHIHAEASNKILNRCFLSILFLRPSGHECPFQRERVAE